MPMTIAALCQAGDLKIAYDQAKAALTERPDSSFTQADMHLVVLTCLKKYAGQGDARTSARWIRQAAALGLPPHAGRDEQMYWELRKLLAALAKHQDPPLAGVTELLRALPLLAVAQVPSLGWSVLLKAALKFQEQLPPRGGPGGTWTCCGRKITCKRHSRRPAQIRQSDYPRWLK